jgi:hypothetical protein
VKSSTTTAAPRAGGSAAAARVHEEQRNASVTSHEERIRGDTPHLAVWFRSSAGRASPRGRGVLDAFTRRRPGARRASTSPIETAKRPVSSSYVRRVNLTPFVFVASSHLQDGIQQRACRSLRQAPP